MEPKLLTAERFVDMRTEIMYRYVVSDTEYFRPHYHDYCEVFMMLEGEARHQVNGAVVPVSARDIIFVRPSDTHDYVSVSGKPFSMLNITFTTDTLGSIFSFLGDGFPSRKLLSAKYPPGVRLTAGEFAAFQTRMQAIRAISTEDVPALKTALRVLLFDVFTMYFSDFRSGSDAAPAWLDTLCAQMRKDGNFIGGSERLFALTDKSREHVFRSMKKYMGQTVSEFVNDLRLNYIANMLKNSNHSVTQIIFDSGFNNISWAAECFRKKYGMTMRQFRKG